MVGLRSVDLARVFTRSQCRLLDHCPACVRLRQHRHRNQHHRHHPLYEVPGHEAEPYAVACLAEPGNVRHGAHRHHAVVSGADHVARGSVSGGPLLRYAGGRVSPTLDAFLLDLRASGGVRPDYSLLCVYVGNYSGILPEADFRLPGHGWGHGLYRLREHECVGAPHVHHWDELVRQQLFRDHHNGGRCSDGNQNLQLARHHVGWKNPIQDPDAVLRRISVSVFDRWPYRHHAFLSAV